eukprot:4775972-Prorocentrum_lima.AAC.1
MVARCRKRIFARVPLSLRNACPRCMVWSAQVVLFRHVRGGQVCGGGEAGQGDEEGRKGREGRMGKGRRGSGLL